MILPESRTWTLGKYTVILREHPPQAPSYTVMRAGMVVGTSASNPNADQCASIERITASGRYVNEGRPVKFHSYRLPKHNAASAIKGRRAAKVSKILSKIG